MNFRRSELDPVLKIGTLPVWDDGHLPVDGYGQQQAGSLTSKGRWQAAEIT
jgi:hypothetical protein